MYSPGFARVGLIVIGHRYADNQQWASKSQFHYALLTICQGASKWSNIQSVGWKCWKNPDRLSWIDHLLTEGSHPGPNVNVLWTVCKGWQRWQIRLFLNVSWVQNCPDITQTWDLSNLLHKHFTNKSENLPETRVNYDSFDP